MKTQAIALIALCTLMAGCIGTQQQATEINTSTGEIKNTTTNEPTFIQGTFELSVQQCYGTKLRILNNGTGTAYLDDSIKIESKGGVTRYGSIKGNTTIQPAETKIVDLTNDLNAINETSFTLYKPLTKDDGGTIHIRFAFTC